MWHRAVPPVACSGTAALPAESVSPAVGGPAMTPKPPPPPTQDPAGPPLGSKLVAPDMKATYRPSVEITEKRLGEFPSTPSDWLTTCGFTGSPSPSRSTAITWMVPNVPGAGPPVVVVGPATVVV